MSRELFIYWKLPEAHAAQALAATAAMQRELTQATPGLQCRLHRRADARNGLLTLMESYRHTADVDAPIEALIAAAAARHLAAWADAQRHVEVFEAIGD